MAIQVSEKTLTQRCFVFASSRPQRLESVKFDGQTATITYNPEQATPDAIVEAIEAGGDTATKVTKL